MFNTIWNWFVLDQSYESSSYKKRYYVVWNFWPTLSEQEKMTMKGRIYKRCKNPIWNYKFRIKKSDLRNFIWQLILLLSKRNWKEYNWKFKNPYMYTDSFFFCPQDWQIQNWEIQSDISVFSSAKMSHICVWGERESNSGLKEETKSTDLSFSGEMSEPLKWLESKVRRRTIPATLKNRNWMLFRLKIRMNEKHPKYLSRVFFLGNEQMLQVKAKAANTCWQRVLR